MAGYNYQEIDCKIKELNQKIRLAVLGENPVLKKKKSKRSARFLSVQESTKTAETILFMVDSAAEEIKQYIEQIWNDNEKREEMLEKLQDELNENIRFLKSERAKLECYLAEKKAVLEKEKGVESSIRIVIDKLKATEDKLWEIYDVYKSANEKGWKIVFYPKLASKALTYSSANKDRVLEERKKNYRNDYENLFREQKNNRKRN